MAVQLNNAKAAAADEVVRLKEHYTRQLQDMYAGVVAQTVFILKHDLNIKGITVEQFPWGVKHIGFLQSLRDAEDEEDEEDDESGGEELPNTGSHSSQGLGSLPYSGTSTD